MNVRSFFRYTQAFLSYNSGKVSLKYPPMFYSIEPTNICNFQCLYCPQGSPQIDKLKKGYMSLELYERILGEIKETKPLGGIFLTGNGEPLLHPNFERFIALANEYKLFPSFSSNGSLFTQKRIKSLADAGDFSVTIDFSPQKEIFETYRKGGNWEEVYQNLRNLLLFKKKFKKNIQIIIRDMSTIGIKDKESQRRSFQQLKILFRNLPVARFCQVIFHGWTGNIDSKLVPKNENQAGWVLCTHPWSLFTITYNGEVVGCCRDLMSDYIIGNIDNQQSIYQIWNSDRMKFLRQALVGKNFNQIKLCKNCDRPRFGGSLGKSKFQMIRRVFSNK